MSRKTTHFKRFDLYNVKKDLDFVFLPHPKRNLFSIYLNDKQIGWIEQNDAPRKGKLYCEPFQFFVTIYSNLDLPDTDFTQHDGTQWNVFQIRGEWSYATHEKGYKTATTALRAARNWVINHFV